MRKQSNAATHAWECAGKKTIAATAHVAADVSQGENSSSIVAPAAASPGPGTAAAAAAVAAADRLRDDLADQLWVVRQAEDAARVTGL
ncbi:hypothetical protein HPB47_024970 [Ixodes persulcatus]|uniref:Uncharacterized protein n=1 Tax=Ixodes persulcatus TaxID=34615 RepID=A0AC60Q555_IXOPE|nr:hypothetical protein HPB47_024970 [Ixodes persulcatus]